MNAAQRLDLVIREAASPRRQLGLVVLVVVIAVGALAVWTALPLLELPFISPGQPPAPVGEAALIKKQEAFAQLLAKSRDAVTAREPFGRLSGQRPPPTPSGPVTPRTYGGPGIIGMADNTVWFADGKKVRPGDTVDSGGVTVIELDAPWSAKVRWRGADFTVAFFERDPARFAQPISVWHGAPPPAPAPAKPDATTAAAPPPGPPGAPGQPGGPPVVAPSTAGALPIGVTVTGGAPGGPVVVVPTPATAAPPPPPPPPPDEDGGG